MTVVLDYGVGNLTSVLNALRALGETPELVADPEAVRRAERLILPGVGAFAPARSRLTPFEEAIRERVAAGKPTLGICLGMQLLFERSYEHGVHEGLGLLSGEVVSLREALGAESERDKRCEIRYPHIGWTPLRDPCGRLMSGVEEGAQVYFVHSYGVLDAEACVAWAEHGVRFCAAVERENLFGAQFHPEKSGAVGLTILENFLRC
ncbi:MAG: imidazole glycerol phosphate synthase subunit HisH [Fimbriimonadales bacterium]|nr:MAG: imidazole glycerol phosphate synthase subunit HisH [Fimbriimonadales bacterium]